MAKEKKVRFTYHIINIKLYSNRRSGTEGYKQLFRDIFTNSITKPTHRGKSVILRTLFPSMLNDKEFYHGKISRYTDLDNPDWINLTTKEIENVAIPEGVFPNLQETEYIFVPQAHRFILIMSPNISVSNALDFFTQAIPEVIEADEDFTVHVEQSEDVFEQIYNALRVERLEISISYTNSDLKNDAVAWMDDILKESDTKNAFLRFDSERQGTINVHSDIITGSLGLARENGFAKARIKDIDNRIKTINTVQHPKKERGDANNEAEVKDVVFSKVMQVYRNNE